jgi:arabinogalactan endo-1,4-beta-galactosidase
VKKCLLVLTVLSLMMALPQAIAQSSSLYVHKQDLAEDFILGMDVSSVIALENSGVTFRDFDGKARDLFSILKDNGINYIRVRVWNDPFDEAGRGYGGGNNDLNTAISIGQRAAENGMKLLVDFHYSDFWADPGKQQAPKAWAGMDIKEKQAALYDFTLDALTQLQAAGADIGMVQLGNETNGRMAGERTWMNIYYLMAAGAKATREVDPNIKIAVHFANPESAGSYMNYASKLDYYKLDYDIFASSYYPFWHGTLDNLTAVLNEVQTTYHKQVLVMETSYANTLEDTDHHPNAIGEGSNYETPYPISIQGQANAVADVIRAVNSIGGLGVFYWEGAWITVGGTYEENQRKWEEHGAGWASSYAAAYDPKDAGQYYGGSAWDNQAFFDKNGAALESLKLFQLLRTGNVVPLEVDAIAQLEVTFDLNEDITLPGTVHAVMNDGSTREVPVIWDDVDLGKLKTGGVASYTITGKAEGTPAVCQVNMVEFNYLKNGSFEEEDTSMWVAVDHKQADQLYVEEKKTDAKEGTRHYHFYSAKKDSVDFTLSQQVRDLPAGQYAFEISIQGGDGGQTEIYSFVMINGELIHQAPSQITHYNSWHSPRISGIDVKAGDVVEVGMRVVCEGPGAWGKIDDARLNRMPGM